MSKEEIENYEWEVGRTFTTPQEKLAFNSGLGVGKMYADQQSEAMALEFAEYINMEGWIKTHWGWIPPYQTPNDNERSLKERSISTKTLFDIMQSDVRWISNKFKNEKGV